jgi:hypothetical protein
MFPYLCPHVVCGIAKALVECTFINPQIGNTKGAFTYTNGDVYDGEFLNGERHGNGVMTYIEDGSVYEGQWANGRHFVFGILVSLGRRIQRYVRYATNYTASAF